LIDRVDGVLRGFAPDEGLGRLLIVNLDEQKMGQLYYLASLTEKLRLCSRSSLVSPQQGGARLPE
jgi:hypothetical protein